ncbi:ScyD/ScyE family protein [Cellulosimicrobium sp. NPDC057127]|uniref:ScyD/ScyE family protein n=1 Tax=Cellulosimicrobium sp. NPDC057127 TaxID=3346026 RepID=UPI00362C78B5
MRRVPTVLAAAATTLLLAATPAVAHGGGRPDPRPPTVTDVTTGLVGPLSLAVGHHGTTYVTQDFAGLLTAVDRRGTQTVLYESGGPEVAGVSYDGHRTLTFTETVADPETMAISASAVKTLRLDRRGAPSGDPAVLVDTYAFEQANNPDAGVTYGLRDTDPACVAQIPENPMFPALYQGIEDSHAYATTSWLGTTFVADAGSNTVLSVDRRGTVRTVAVLPAQPATITPEAAAAVGWPECAVGQTYWFEPVPTDVEVGPFGQLYVTTLPGGPEDPSLGLGARGAVYTVDPWRGRTRQVATGFVSATDLAVSPRGDVYVAELFGGRISEVKRGGPRTVVEVPLPAALEWDGRGLLATTNALPGEGAPPDGHLVRVDLGKRWGHWGR